MIPRLVPRRSSERLSKIPLTISTGGIPVSKGMESPKSDTSKSDESLSLVSSQGSQGSPTSTPKLKDPLSRVKSQHTMPINVNALDAAIARTPSMIGRSPLSNESSPDVSSRESDSDTPKKHPTTHTVSDDGITKRLKLLCMAKKLEDLHIEDQARLATLQRRVSMS